MSRKKVIAITMGDPAGVGPEICLKALADLRVRAACIPVIIGSADVLRTVAQKLAIPFADPVIQPGDAAGAPAPTEPCVIDIAAISAADIQPGRVSAQCGHAAFEYVACAIEQTAAVRLGDTLQQGVPSGMSLAYSAETVASAAKAGSNAAGIFDAMATAPISKQALHAAGINFPGHTEILESLAGNAHGRMGAREHGRNRLRIADCGLRNTSPRRHGEHGKKECCSPPYSPCLCGESSIRNFTRRSFSEGGPKSEIGCAHAVMMLTSPRLTVSLVTTHIPLKDVPAALNRERVEHVIRLTHDTMTRLLGRTPRIAVLGLNCHAGESGLFGNEEQETIIPAIDAARAEGIAVTGPLPPDTAFTPQALETCDAHVCMYHDQALIPFKTLSFADGVNVTLGIPIIRTSVDHGTAFDIAWTGKAGHQSLVAAVLLAAKLANKYDYD